jgi:hypothetical protein
VDVYLKANIIDPAPAVPPPIDVLDLRIVASDPTLPPKVVSIVATSQEIELSFNKPMNPAGASNVKNYAVYVEGDTHAPSTLGGLLGKSYSFSVTSWLLKSAQYDPTSQTVTLIPRHQNLSIDMFTGATQLQRVRTSGNGKHQSKAAPGLIDVQGNPINADTTPGKVGIRLSIPTITGSF